MASKYFKVNTKSKTITLDLKEKPTAQDDILIDRYLSSGYKLRVKSEARAKAARERAEKTGFGKNNKKKTEETETTAE